MAEPTRHYETDRQVAATVGRLALKAFCDASCESRLTLLIVDDPSSLHLARN